MNGQCYPNSFHYLEKLTRIGDEEFDPIEREKFEDLALIHGNVVPTEGVDKGKVIDHAWIEMSGHAFDVAEDVDHPATKPINEYRERFKVQVRASYTLDKARAFIEITQMYGPWDSEGRSMRSLDPLPPKQHNG